MTAFLKAAWRKLAMANYAIDPSLLSDFIPPKTEIDLWNGTCYVSLVGFMFLDTKLKGIGIPFHANFEEVNLRFYVRYKDKGEWKRGVVFLKEFVPKPALTFVANLIYKENYQTLPMKHLWEEKDGKLTVEYQWKKGRWNTFRVVAEPELIDIAVGCEHEFITEHYWGYTKAGSDKCSEYGVEHPRWQVYDVKDYTIDVDFEACYGKQFGFLKSMRPTSVFLAEGSEIIVRDGALV